MTSNVTTLLLTITGSFSFHGGYAVFGFSRTRRRPPKGVTTALPTGERQQHISWTTILKTGVPGCDVHHAIHNSGAGGANRSTARFDTVDGFEIFRGVVLPDRSAIEAGKGAKRPVQPGAEHNSRNHTHGRADPRVLCHRFMWRNVHEPSFQTVPQPDRHQSSVTASHRRSTRALHPQLHRREFALC